MNQQSINYNRRFDTLQENQIQEMESDRNSHAYIKPQGDHHSDSFGD